MHRCCIDADGFVLVCNEFVFSLIGVALIVVVFGFVGFRLIHIDV